MTIVVLVLTRVQSGQHRNASTGDFISVVRTLPGALSRLILPSLGRFVLLRTLCGVYSATGSSIKLDALDNN